jgi:hypothetical protein
MDLVLQLPEGAVLLPRAGLPGWEPGGRPDRRVLCEARTRPDSGEGDARSWTGYRDRKGPGDVMFMTLCLVLFVAWLLGFGAFHVAGGLIHLLLVLAVISLIVHFVRGRGATI